MNNAPYTEPCKDPRHTGRIREQLGCNGPDPAGLTAAEAMANAGANVPAFAAAGLTAAEAMANAGANVPAFAAAGLTAAEAMANAGANVPAFAAAGLTAAEAMANAGANVPAFAAAGLTAEEATSNGTANSATVGITAAAEQPVPALSGVEEQPAPVEEQPEPVEPTHEGPDPSHGGLTTHRGPREQCTGPDCTAEPLATVVLRPTDDPDELSATAASHGISPAAVAYALREAAAAFDTAARAQGIEPIARNVEEQPATGDVFTEAAVSRSALLAGITTIEALPQRGHGRADIGDAVTVLRRLADHYATNEQPAGLTWEARTAHAVRLYATTAIEREDARAEAAKLRTRVAELEKRDAWLSTLEAAGVDSWSGMEHAISMRNDADDQAEEQPAPLTAAEVEQGQADADALAAEHPDTIESLLDEIAEDIPNRRADAIAADYLARYTRLLAAEAHAHTSQRGTEMREAGYRGRGVWTSGMREVARLLDARAATVAEAGR